MGSTRYMRERAILSFLDKCYELKYKFIAKGTIGVNVTIQNYGKYNIQRREVDIVELEYLDSDDNVDIVQIENMIKHCLSNMPGKFKLANGPQMRYNRGLRYSFRVINIENEVIFTIKVNKSSNPNYKSYLIGEYMIQCRDIDSLITERLSSVPTSSIGRSRVMYDLYLLSYVGGSQTGWIRQFRKFYGSQTSNVKRLLVKGNELREAYETQLDGIRIKPDFNDVYRRTMQFVEPFVKNNKDDLFWSGYAWVK